MVVHRPERLEAGAARAASREMGVECRALVAVEVAVVIRFEGRARSEHGVPLFYPGLDGSTDQGPSALRRAARARWRWTPAAPLEQPRMSPISSVVRSVFR